MTGEPTPNGHENGHENGPQVVVIHRTVPRSSRILAVAATLLAGTAGIGLFATMRDRDGWRDVARDLRVQNTNLQVQLDSQASTSSCRSEANFDTDEKASEVAIIVARALAAVGRGESPAAFADQLEVAADDYRAAIDARKIKLTTCAEPAAEEEP